MLGTNPLVFAMPTDEPFPFTNDYATSVIQRGKIEQWAREGKDCPKGLVINQEGESATDSVQILKDLVKGTAALAPIGGLTEETGGYKGYGFATVVEILSAAFSQGAFLKQLGGKDADGNNIPIPIGHFFLAVDVECFTDLDAFKKTTGDILRELRASRKAPGRERIYTCGEKEYLAWSDRKDKGIPVGAETQKELLAMRDDLDLPYVFPFEK
jgi:LDH2 family malate/lactate/ureidoglycolate dehydrogenase